MLGLVTFLAARSPPLYPLSTQKPWACWIAARSFVTRAACRNLALSTEDRRSVFSFASIVTRHWNAGTQHSILMEFVHFPVSSHFNAVSSYAVCTFMGQETPTSARPLASSCAAVGRVGISLAVKVHAGFALRFCSLTVCCSQLFKDVPSREIEGAISERCMF